MNPKKGRRIKRIKDGNTRCFRHAKVIFLNVIKVLHHHVQTDPGLLPVSPPMSNEGSLPPNKGGGGGGAIQFSASNTGVLTLFQCTSVSRSGFKKFTLNYITMYNLSQLHLIGYYEDVTC
jgi:hypothetical protein